MEVVATQYETNDASAVRDGEPRADVRERGNPTSADRGSGLLLLGLGLTCVLFCKQNRYLASLSPGQLENSALRGLTFDDEDTRTRIDDKLTGQGALGAALYYSNQGSSDRANDAEMSELLAQVSEELAGSDCRVALHPAACQRGFDLCDGLAVAPETLQTDCNIEAARTMTM